MFMVTWGPDEVSEWPISIFNEEFFEDNRESWPDAVLMYVAM